MMKRDTLGFTLQVTIYFALTSPLLVIFLKRVVIDHHLYFNITQDMPTL